MLSSTTEGMKLTTFQSIQDARPGGITTTSPIKITTKPPTLSTAQRTKKPVSSSTKKPVSQALNRTSVSSDGSSTVRPTRRPVTTLKPSKTTTSTVIKTTRKPAASTIVTVNRRTTISSRRNSTTISTRKPTQASSPSSISTSPSVSTTPAMLTTISYVETTKAPRPRPTPTDFIVKVEPTTLSAEDMLVTTFSVESDEKLSSTAKEKPALTTAKPTKSTSTVKSTVVTRRTTKRPSTTSATSKRPITEPTSTSINASFAQITKDEATTSKPLSLTTVERTEEKVEIPTTSAHGLVTWTLGNDVVENTTKGEKKLALRLSLTFACLHHLHCS